MSAQTTPLVSICIASYNYDKYIGEAIESVFAQTYENWELIVVDDASTDNSVSIISELQQCHPDKVNFISSAKNRGVCQTFNEAYSKARGEFIAILGADDRMLPARLEIQVAFLQKHANVGVVCSDVNTIDSQGKDISFASVFSQPILNLRSQLLEGNFLNAPSAMFRTRILKEVGFLNPVLDYVQDFDHWLRILEHYDIERLPQRLTEYRVHGKNLSMRQAGNHAYAGRYETMTVIFNAIKRRDNLINVDVLTAKQIIEEKLFLANAAKKAEYKFLGTFKYSVNIVYGLVLDVLMLDVSHQQAHELLKTVYSAFGDMPRSQGKKPITDNELNLLEQDNKESRSLYQIAIDTHEQTGASLAKIVKNLLKTEASLITAQIKQERQEKGGIGLNNPVSSADRRNYFCANLVSDIVNRAESLVDYSEGKRIPKKMRDELYESLNILDEEQTLGQVDVVAQELKNQIRELLDNDRYQTWVRKHALREIDAEIIAEQMMLKWQIHPELHCILFFLPGDGALLADTIDSLASQLYSKWHLTVIAETESPDSIFEQVDNLHWIVLAQNESPYDVVNREIKNLNTQWTIFIEPGTQFEVHALAKIAEYSNLYPDWSFIYTDDDLIEPSGVRTTPRFKPDFNLDLLRSSPYIGSGWMRTPELLTLGGIRQFSGAENYDIALRWLDHYGEAVVGHIADVLIHYPKAGDRPFDASAGMVALEQHLARNKLNTSIQQGYIDNSYRIEYLHEEQPKVTVIIPTKDKLEYFQPCIESLLQKTTYPNFEVIVVDNQSTDLDTLAYYQTLTEQYSSDKLKICYYDKPFNFSAMNNLAAEKATGDYLLMLNNDTEIIQDEWLSRMMSYGQREDVGIVGARLVFPTSGKLQHAGVILGLGQIADHPYIGELGLADKGHMGRALLEQDFSVVTAAVLLIKKEIYHHVGGMDAEELAILFNDVDLCIKVRELGYKILWTPYATVVHHGSTSVRGKAEGPYSDINAEFNKKTRVRQEQRSMWERWLPQLAADPAYNKNLVLNNQSFSVDINGLQNWDVNIHTRLRCFGVPLSGGSGYYRITQPFNMLSQSGLAQCELGVHHIFLTEAARMKPDTYVFQNVVKNEEIDNIRLIGEYLPEIFKVYSLDDLLHDLPENSSQYRPLKASYRDMKSRIRKVLKYCDRLIVSTQPLADLCLDMIKDIRVIPNRLEGKVWSILTSKRQQGDKPRVGWAGAQQHYGDLEIIFDVVKETADKVDWIFMGMCPDEIMPFVKEYHEFTSIENYPEKLASLNLDLAVAPLEQHPFNEAKSNLRILEYGILGWPVICTDILPYQSYEAPVIRVPNDKQAWIDTISKAVSSTKKLQNSGDNLRQWVLDNFIIEDHSQEWKDALTAGDT